MRTLHVAVVVLALSASASAQQLTLQFQDGRVSVDAERVPVATILAEWARLGGTKVVNGEKVTGAPLTLRLENIPEAHALEIILRNVAGYMAAPRAANATGASSYDRILVMPTSTAPAAAAASTRTNTGNAASQRNVRPGFGAPMQPPDDQFNAEESDTGVNEPPAFAFPQPGQNPFQAVGQPGPFGTPVPMGSQPQMMQLGQEAQSISINPSPQTTPVLQFPGMPIGGTGATGGFGIVGSPTPGVVQQPAVPNQPGVRPPGGQ
jgi:hypothetical protein